jgi:hypothetical protein
MKEKRMAKKKKEKSNKENGGDGWTGVLLIYVPLAILAVSTIMLLILLYEENVSYALPLIVVFGVIGFLAALTTTTTVLSHFNLTNRNEALGLPSGSVRALIALSLILIFAIMVIFMQGQLSPKPLTYENGTIMMDQNNTIIYTEVSEAQKDFSLQTLTTVSTLVVALAGFYFGTKSVEVAKGVSEAPEITVNPEGDVNLDFNEQKVLYPIRVKTAPENEAVNWKIDDEKNGKLEPIKQNEFKYTPSESAEDVVSLTFQLAKNPEISESIKVHILNKSQTAQQQQKKIEDDLKKLSYEKAGLEAREKALTEEKKKNDEELKKNPDDKKREELEKKQKDFEKELKEIGERKAEIEKEETKLAEEKKALENKTKKKTDETVTKE